MHSLVFCLFCFLNNNISIFSLHPQLTSHHLPGTHVYHISYFPCQQTLLSTGLFLKNVGIHLKETKLISDQIHWLPKNKIKSTGKKSKLFGSFLYLFLFTSYLNQPCHRFANLVKSIAILFITYKVKDLKICFDESWNELKVVTLSIYNDTISRQIGTWSLHFGYVQEAHNIVIWCSDRSL